MEIFPGYDQTKDLLFGMDAALITLPNSFNLDHFVNVICLPNKFGPIDESWNGKMLTMTGFGRINQSFVPANLHLGQKCMINNFLKCLKHILRYIDLQFQ